MPFDFNVLVDKIPAGIVITDPQLEVLHMNAHARNQIFELRPGQDTGAVMLRRRFYTTDRQHFDMSGCMQEMIARQQRIFHKTLILKKRDDEALIYFTVNGFNTEGSDYYIFMLADISNEMDCVVHAPGGFGREDFVLSKRIIGHDEKIRSIYRMIRLAADSMVNVMVTGESGTGKELVADAIHFLSARRDKPMVKVNCTALSESLLESELFGHVKGAFTGAVKDRAGKFEEADGGTLFLDEIGEISPSLQVKLLRVIQEKTIERVGDNRPIRVDMRIIAATNKDLRRIVQREEFREDLFYRLNVFSIHMPSLRERPLDIPRLCDHFVDQGNRNTGKQIKGISKDAMRLMMQYPWPGNIRELQNAIEYAFVLAQNSMITREDLPEAVVSGEEAYGNPEKRKDPDNIELSHEPVLRKKRGGRLNISKKQLKAALESHGWNQSQTARTLGISRVALWKKMKKLGL